MNMWTDIAVENAGELKDFLFAGFRMDGAGSADGR